MYGKYYPYATNAQVLTDHSADWIGVVEPSQEKLISQDVGRQKCSPTELERREEVQIAV